MSYLYKPQQYYLPASISLAAENGATALDSLLPKTPEATTPASSSLDDVLEASANAFGSLNSDKHSSALLYLFLAHAHVLRTIPLHARAQRIPRPSDDLIKTLESFLASAFSSVAAAIRQLPLTDALNDIDIDGRVFYLLVNEVLTASSASETGDLVELLGPTVHQAAEALWARVSVKTQPDFAALRADFPSESNELPSLPAARDTETVLPFSNPVSDEHLKDVHVATAERDTAATIQNQLPRDSKFDDVTYWENPKPVLPTHLGGPAPPVLDARARKKRDRKEQRFSEYLRIHESSYAFADRQFRFTVAAMQKSAASLTGASGASLKQQAIPAVGKRSASGLKAAAAAKENARPSSNANSRSSTPKPGSKPAPAKALTSKEKLLAENAAKK